MANPVALLQSITYGMRGASKVANKLDKFGELSLLGGAITQDTERLIPVAEKFVDDTMTSALGVNKQQILQDDTARKIYNNYRTGLNRVLGGETGLRWLAKNAPADFDNELEGIIGGVRERMTDDLFELSKIDPHEIRKIKMGNTFFTKGHLSVVDYKQTNPVMQVLDDNLSYIENTLREVTEPLIKNSSRFKSFEDFQRKSMNYSILDRIAKLSKIAIENPSKEAFENLRDFNRSYAMVLQGGEKLRPELFGVFNKLETAAKSVNSGDLAGNFRFHYYDPRTTSKYQVALNVEEGGRSIRPMSGARRFELNVLPDELYNEGLRQGMAGRSQKMTFHINKVNELSIKDKGQRLAEHLESLGFRNKFERPGTPDERLFVEVSNDADELKAYELVEKFAESDSINDTINMKKALGTLDYNALVNSTDMSPQSLGVFLSESERNKQMMSRAILRGEKGVYTEPQIATNMMQEINDVSMDRNVERLRRFMATIEPVSLDGVTPVGMKIPSILLEVNENVAYMSGYVNSGLPRMTRRGVVFDITAKNIQVDGMFSAFSRRQSGLNSDNLFNVMADVAKENEIEGGFKGLLSKVYTAETGKVKPLDKINIKEKLGLARASLRAVSTNTRLNNLAKDLNVTPKEVVDSAARYLAEIEQLGRKVLSNDFKLIGKGLDDYKFDDAGDILRGTDEWEIKIEHTPIRQGRFMKLDEAVNSLKAFVPPVFGLNFNFVSSDKKS
jgi:hypothetical protein